MSVLNELQEAVTGCQICGGKGYLETAFHPGLGDLPSKTERCSCLHALLFGRALLAAGVPDEFLKTLDLEPRQNEDVAEVIREYCERFSAARKHGLGLILTGPLGVGKTMFGTQIVARALKAGFSAGYTTFPELLIQIKRGWTDPAVKERVYLLSLVDFLFLDEVGSEYKRIDDTYVSTEIAVLFRTRRSRNLPILIGTNLSVPDLGDEYGEHGKILFSLLAGRMKVLRLKGEDQRRCGGKFDQLLRGE
jgi:DNA replication protein DnaC